MEFKNETTNNMVRYWLERRATMEQQRKAYNAIVERCISFDRKIYTYEEFLQVIETWDIQDLMLMASKTPNFALRDDLFYTFSKDSETFIVGTYRQCMQYTWYALLDKAFFVSDLPNTLQALIELWEDGDDD